MATRNNLVTFEEAAARIGVLPTLEPRPNAVNIRITTKALTEALQGIPSYQSQAFGYMGFVVTPEEYALIGEPGWQNFDDPGFHRPLGGLQQPNATPTCNTAWQRTFSRARKM